MIYKRGGIELEIHYNQYGYAIFDGKTKLSKTLATNDAIKKELEVNLDYYFNKALEIRYKY